MSLSEATGVRSECYLAMSRPGMGSPEVPSSIESVLTMRSSISFRLPLYGALTSPARYEHHGLISAGHGVHSVPTGKTSAQCRVAHRVGNACKDICSLL